MSVAPAPAVVASLPDVWPITAKEAYFPSPINVSQSAIQAVHDALVPKSLLQLTSLGAMSNLIRALRESQGLPVAQGRLFVLRHPRSSSSHELVNPVFMVWGFDPNASGRDVNYVQEALAGHEGIDYDDPLWQTRHRDPWLCPETGGLVKLLHDHGRDVCILVPNDATRELQSNALLVLAALDRVFEASAPGTEVPVIGFSAGGMLCRWALLHLEDLGGRRHQLYPSIGHISAYGTYDTPHYGANVPPSIQMLVNYLADHFAPLFLVSADAMGALRAINSPAACQLAWYHYGGVNPWAKHDVGPHPLRLILAEEFGGRWPQGIPRFAYANGPANWHVFKGAMPGKPMLTIADENVMQIKALPNGNEGEGNDMLTIGHRAARLYWGWINRAEPLDSAPGSRTGFYQQVVNGLNFLARSDLMKSHPELYWLTEGITKAMPEVPASCFVPTVSALHLSTQVWQDCVHNLVQRDGMVPPFHRWQCAPDSSHERHVQITDASARFVLSCVSRGGF